MFPKFLRLGPLVFTQISFLLVAAFIKLATTLSDCYCYTLVGLALQAFLIEMIVAMRILKKSKPMRRKYLSHLVSLPKCKYNLTMTWNSFNIILVIGILMSCPIIDLINLTDLDYTELLNFGKEVNCEFTLYTVCLFVEINSHRIGYYEYMTTWLLFSCGLFLDVLILVVFLKQFMNYLTSVSHNRKIRVSLEVEHLESLLDCHIYGIHLKDPEESLQEMGECPICLHAFVKKTDQTTLDEYEKIVKLKCNHLFHKECILKWLKLRDSCPLKCNL